MISARTETSSIETGSSATINFGDSIIERTIDRRCSCPTESSCGYRFRKSFAGFNPASSSSCSHFRSRSSLFAPIRWIFMTRSKMFCIVSPGGNVSNGFWNTICAVRRNPFRSFFIRSVSDCPPYVTVPDVISSSPISIRPSVDFPQPLSPMTPSTSPGSIEKLTSSTACTNCLPLLPRIG